MKRSKSEERILRALRDKVQFKNAALRIDEDQLARLQASHHMGSPVPTQVIRESTRLYTDSWILPLIDALLSGDAAAIREAAKYV